MTTHVEATLINGVLKPDQPVPLPENSRVRLTIESIEPIAEWSPEKAKAAWEAILARLKEHPIHGCGVRYTRDELHERR
jgi:predicted DNA-binding antitoxin AbrB/MazE fold protein